MSSASIPRYDLAGKRVWVAGHHGLVGSALVRRLALENCEVLTVARADLDLRRQVEVEQWMERARPDAVIVAAATVGGILANDTRPAEFLYDNLAMGANIIESSRRIGVAKLLYLGSSCIYPRLASQPMEEDALLSGPLEPTNQWYAIAKISNLMLCRAYRRQHGCDFVSAMPTNLYGPGDKFDLFSSHVIPALIAKADQVRRGEIADFVVWGSGTPRREFMYVDDAADALVFLLKNYSDEKHINIGVGYDIAIRDLAEKIARIVGVERPIRFDASKPDGPPRKLMDSSHLLAMGWSPRTSIDTGLQATCAWFTERFASSLPVR